VLTEKSLQLKNILREPFRSSGICAHGPRRGLVAARCSAEAKIYAARMERCQRAELLGDAERRVIREHHPSSAKTDSICLRCNMRNQDTWRRGTNHRHVVMLGIPNSLVATGFGSLSEGDATLEGFSR
jgi:hypothetical protein